MELDISNQNTIILPLVPPNRAGRHTVVGIGSHQRTELFMVRKVSEARHFAVRSQTDVPWGQSSAL